MSNFEGSNKLDPYFQGEIDRAIEGDSLRDTFYFLARVNSFNPEQTKEEIINTGAKVYSAVGNIFTVAAEGVEQVKAIAAINNVLTMDYSR